MKIVSDRPLRVTTLGGTAVLFESGVVREVAEEIGLLAVQMGAKQYNERYIEESEAEVAVFEDVTPSETPVDNSSLVTVLEKMMDEGDPKNFKADGYPKAASVNRAMGVTISTDEREEAWTSILNS